MFILRTGAILAIFLSALAGCTLRSSYSGVNLRTGGAEATIQDTARRAMAGDKQAQLELGIAYEEGRHLPVDQKRALQLYARAASATGGTLFVYSPPVRKGGRGTMVPVYTGPRMEGVPEAKRRFERLKASVVAPRS